MKYLFVALMVPASFLLLGQVPQAASQREADTESGVAAFVPYASSGKRVYLLGEAVALGEKEVDVLERLRRKNPSDNFTSNGPFLQRWDSKGWITPEGNFSCQNGIVSHISTSASIVGSQVPILNLLSDILRENFGDSSAISYRSWSSVTNTPNGVAINYRFLEFYSVDDTVNVGASWDPYDPSGAVSVMKTFRLTPLQ
jgi:hypothetical protein